MHEEEAHKIFIIFLPDTLSYPSLNNYVPDTVMIEFRHTHLTNATVFRSSRLSKITCWAFVILLIKYSIVIFFILLHVGIS